MEAKFKPGDVLNFKFDNDSHEYKCFYVKYISAEESHFIGHPLYMWRCFNKESKEIYLTTTAF